MISFDQDNGVRAMFTDNLSEGERYVFIEAMEHCEDLLREKGHFDAVKVIASETDWFCKNLQQDHPIEKPKI